MVEAPRPGSGQWRPRPSTAAASATSAGPRSDRATPSPVPWTACCPPGAPLLTAASRVEEAPSPGTEQSSLPPSTAAGSVTTTGARSGRVTLVPATGKSVQHVSIFTCDTPSGITTRAPSTACCPPGRRRVTAARSAGAGSRPGPGPSPGSRSTAAGSAAPTPPWCGAVTTTLVLEVCQDKDICFYPELNTTSLLFLYFFKPTNALLPLRLGQNVGMGVLARLAACRGDVVMTTAFLVQIGVTKKKVRNGNKMHKANKCLVSVCQV